MKTRVIFFFERDSKNEVFAYFPNDNWDFEGNKASYAHVGQHSACSPEYVKHCKLAGPADYADLKEELTNMVKYDLDILNEKEFQYHRNPTLSEIRFGYGATHYKNFPFETVYKWAGSYGLKKWIKCPHDGLRYYR